MINRRAGFFTLIMFAMLISLFFIPKQVKAENSLSEEISIPIYVPSDLNIDLGHSVLPIGSNISSQISIINKLIPSENITITDVQVERTGECWSAYLYETPPIVLMQEDNFTVSIYIATTLPGLEPVPGYNEMYITIFYECSGEDYILHIYKDWKVVGTVPQGSSNRNKKN